MSRKQICKEKGRPTVVCSHDTRYSVIFIPCFILCRVPSCVCTHVFAHLEEQKPKTENFTVSYFDRLFAEFSEDSTPGSDCLYLAQIPFYEDVRQYPFPNIATLASNQPSGAISFPSIHYVNCFAQCALITHISSKPRDR